MTFQKKLLLVGLLVPIAAFVSALSWTTLVPAIEAVSDDEAASVVGGCNQLTVNVYCGPPADFCTLVPEYKENVPTGQTLANASCGGCGYVQTAYGDVCAPGS